MTLYPKLLLVIQQQLRLTVEIGSSVFEIKILKILHCIKTILVFAKLAKEKWRRRRKREIFLRRVRYYRDPTPHFREESFVSPDFEEDWSTEDTPQMEDPIYDSVSSLTVTLHPELVSRERESVL